MSIEKVRVTRLLGGSATIGLIDPKVGMVTGQGTITALDSGNFQVTVSGAGVGSPRKAYPHELTLSETLATGTYSFPSGDGSVKFGHKGIFPNGPLQALGTGTAFATGGGTVFTFGR